MIELCTYMCKNQHKNYQWWSYNIAWWCLHASIGGIWHNPIMAWPLPPPLSTHYNVPGQPHITPPLAHQPWGGGAAPIWPQPTWPVGGRRSNVRLTRNIIVCTKWWWEWPGRNGIMSNSPNDCMEALSCNIVWPSLVVFVLVFTHVCTQFNHSIGEKRVLIIALPGSCHAVVAQLWTSY